MIQQRMPDRRLSQRFEERLPALFRTPKPSEKISFATTENLSAEGLCVVTKERFEPAKKYPFELELPTGEKLFLTTEVVWIQPMEVLATIEYKMGVRLANTISSGFTRYTQFYRDRLKGILQKDRGTHFLLREG